MLANESTPSREVRIARGIDRSRVESHLHIRFTRLGLHTAFIAVFAMVGGALRGFNLLLILAGLLVGLLLIQWRLGRRSLELVRVHRQPVEDVLAGSVFTVRFQIENLSSYLPAWLVMLRDSITPAGSRQSSTAVCGLGAIPANAKREASYDCRIERRGRYLLGPLVVSTGFPFGLLEAKRTVATAQELSLFVYPRPLALNPHWQSVLRSKTGGMSSTHHRAGPQEGDFYGLRQWRSGDSRRWIHWRTTARLGEPAVRQFEQQRRYDMCILVDAFRQPQEDEEAFERVVRFAATLVTQFAMTPTNRVTLVVAGEPVRRTTIKGGRSNVWQAMRILAEIEPTASTSLVGALEAGLESTGGDRPIVIISSQPTDAGRLLESGSRAVRSSVAHLDLRWLDVNGPAVGEMVGWEAG